MGGEGSSNPRPLPCKRSATHAARRCEPPWTAARLAVNLRELLSEGWAEADRWREGPRLVALAALRDREAVARVTARTQVIERQKHLIGIRVAVRGSNPTDLFGALTSPPVDEHEGRRELASSITGSRRRAAGARSSAVVDVLRLRVARGSGRFQTKQRAFLLPQRSRRSLPA